MKTLELEGFGIAELSFGEKETTNGGNPFWIGVAAGIVGCAVYDALKSGAIALGAECDRIAGN